MEFYFKFPGSDILKLSSCFEKVINFILLRRPDCIDIMNDQILDNLTKIISEYPISDFQKPNEIFYSLNNYHNLDKRISEGPSEDLTKILTEAVKTLKMKNFYGNLSRQQFELVQILRDQKKIRESRHLNTNLHNLTTTNSGEIDIDDNLIRVLREYLSKYNLTEENYISCNDNEFYFRKENVDYMIKFNVRLSSNHPLETHKSAQSFHSFKNLFSLLLLFSNCSCLVHGNQESSFLRSFFDILMRIKHRQASNNDLDSFHREFIQVAEIQDTDTPIELTSLLRNLLLFLKEEKYSGYQKFILKTRINGFTNEQSYLEYKKYNSIGKNEIENTFNEFLKKTANVMNEHSQYTIQKEATIDNYVFIYITTPMVITSILDISFLELRSQTFQLIGIINGTNSMASKTYVRKQMSWEVYCGSSSMSLLSQHTIDSVVMLLYEKVDR